VQAFGPRIRPTEMARALRPRYNNPRPLNGSAAGKAMCRKAAAEGRSTAFLLWKPHTRPIEAVNSAHSPASSSRSDSETVRQGTSDGGTSMSFIRVRRPAEDNQKETVEVEGEIRDLLRKEFATARVLLPIATRLPPQPTEGDDQGVGQANSLV